MAWYLDTSAFMKLVIAEDRTVQMRAWALAEEELSGALWSSDLLRTEAMRTARRVSAAAVEAARDRLERISLVSISADTYRRAAELDPQILRALDAIHLAAALSLGDELMGIVTYDQCMSDAALILGLPVLAP